MLNYFDMSIASTLFEEGKFAEAKAAAEQALASESDAGQTRALKLLIRKCNTHLEDAAGASSGPAPASPAVSTAQAEAVAPPPAPAVPAPAKPQTTCRHEWFQTPTTVTFSFYVKNRSIDQVSATTTKRSLDVTIKLDLDKEFQLSHDPLFGEIDDSKTEVHVKQPKVEVVVYKKVPNMHWSAIELTGEAAAQAASTAAVPPAALPQSQAQLAYPNSKGRDWSSYKPEDEKDGDLGGDEGLNKFFRTIYKDASDDVRRAMMKSYQESGGTVMSTNWEDVKSRYVGGGAPKGMEMRKWER